MRCGVWHQGASPDEGSERRVRPGPPRAAGAPCPRVHFLTSVSCLPLAFPELSASDDSSLSDGPLREEGEGRLGEVVRAGRRRPWGSGRARGQAGQGRRGATPAGRWCPCAPHMLTEGGGGRPLPCESLSPAGRAGQGELQPGPRRPGTLFHCALVGARGLSGHSRWPF